MHCFGSFVGFGDDKKYRITIALSLIYYASKPDCTHEPSIVDATPLAMEGEEKDIISSTHKGSAQNWKGNIYTFASSSYTWPIL